MTINFARVALPNGRAAWQAEAWQGSILLAEATRATLADATRDVVQEARRPLVKRERRAA